MEREVEGEKCKCVGGEEGREEGEGEEEEEEAELVNNRSELE